jgi:hypothetical protein
MNEIELRVHIEVDHSYELPDGMSESELHQIHQRLERTDHPAHRHNQAA